MSVTRRSIDHADASMSLDALPPPESVDLGDGVQMSFCFIPNGSFSMGSHGLDKDEEPRHRVTFSEGFWLGTYPVTQQEFAAWTRECKIEHKNTFPHPHEAKHPAEQLTWYQALAFCHWLTPQLPLLNGKRWRATLPTEAQWEYACRRWQEAEATTEYYSGDGEAALAEIGWYNGNKTSLGEDSYGGTKPVISKPDDLYVPNGFGLHQMHGNVWEWCLDAYDAEAYRKRPAATCDPLVLAKLDTPLTHQDFTPMSKFRDLTEDEKSYLQRQLEGRVREDGRSAATPLGVAHPVFGNLSSMQSIDEAHSDADRVLRGGSWIGAAGWCRSAYRDCRRPDFRNWSIGFRVCLVPDPDSNSQSAKRLPPADPWDTGQAVSAGGRQATHGASDDPFRDARLPPQPVEPPDKVDG